MDPEEEGAPEAPRRSAHESQDAHREHALRVLEQREAELDRASSELERIRERYMSELSEGRSDPTLERLLQEAKEL
jgi:tRNA U54 and U55 pseudouridine synthase Pus10